MMRNQPRGTSPTRFQPTQATPGKPATAEMHSPDGLLTWREISDYAGRGVRTLQRWERNFGFPIHRPDIRNKSAVASSKSEVDEWFRTRPMMHGIMKPVRNIGAKELTEAAHKLEVEAGRLRESSRKMLERIRKALAIARKEKTS